MNHFAPLRTTDQIDRFIEENELAFIYIARENCSVCHGLLLQVEQLFENYPKVTCGIIDADEVKEVAGRFSVFTVPVLLLFVEGKEYLREARIVHLQLFDKKINKIYK